MMEKRRRGSVRTGAVALGATLMAFALATSPVGATPFTGQSSGPFLVEFWSAEPGSPLLFTATESPTSGYSTLVGTVQCHSVSRFSVNGRTGRRCAATESEFRVYTESGWDDAPGIARCWSEDKSGIIIAQVVASESYACVPSKCLDSAGSIKADCTTTSHIKYEVIYGTGIYRNSAGNFTITGTSTYDTFHTGSVESEVTGDITLAGGAPKDTVVLETPAEGSTQSGVGLVGGWSCLGGHLEVELSEADGTPILTDSLPHGAYRPTTEQRCGDIHNGFSAPMNWGRLSPGEKTLTLFVNGVERVKRNFFVTTFGGEYVEDAGGECTVPNLRAGQDATFVWQQENQGLVLKESLN